MKYISSVLLLLVVAFISVSAQAENSYQGKISDFHSHVKAGIELDYFIKLMDENNVDAMLLMRRDGKRFDTGSAPLISDKKLISFHKQYPDRIYLGIGMQIKPWRKQDPSLFPQIRRLAKTDEFSLLGEIVLQDERQNKNISPSSFMFKDSLDIASKYRLPVLVHTFNKIGQDESNFLTELRKDKSLTIIWAHMCGFTNPRRISELFEEFPGLHCDLAWLQKTDNIAGQGIVDTDFNFTPAWKQLIESYPDRFLVGVDLTTKKDYEEYYSEYIRRLRVALGGLKPEVARMVATENFHRMFAKK